ncbi:RsfA family transcriptional regulator [Bacillus tianshenii]|nr:RsfA family transcriptional regulator [Bacillus tianshenii]
MKKAIGEMAVNVARQDAWSEDEDLMLAEVVLRHIREGSTQLAAFEEVGRRLSRTAAACGFRWNSTVRKQYDSAVALAKEQRKAGRKTKHSPPPMEVNMKAVAAPLTLQQVITYLEELQGTLQLDKGAQEEELRELRERIKVAEAECEKWKEKFQALEQDYQTMLSIMEKARKMTVMKEEDEEKLRFQMDENGNLERVKKK